jgi:TatD DNase family protein
MSNKFANFLYFDTHCHLNYEPLFGNEAKIIDECVKEKVMVNCVGVDLDTCKKSLAIARQFPSQTIASLGLHPESIDELKQINELENMIKDNLDCVKAIGECGLDYHYQPLDKQKQRDLFIAQILLAIKYNLPLIIHCRDAYEDLYGILEEYFPQLSKILIHCFDGTKE